MVSAADMTIREKTVLLRRKHLLDAATRVFAAKGFHRSTIRDVAVAAGISDGAIYNLFENKAALLLGMFGQLGHEAVDGDPEPLPSSGDVDGLVRTLLRRRWAAYTDETLPMIRVVLSEVLVDAELRALFVERVIAPAVTLPEILFKTLAAERKLASTDAAMTLRMITASFLGLVVLRLLGDEMLEARAREVPDLLADLLLPGLTGLAEPRT